MLGFQYDFIFMVTFQKRRLATSLEIPMMNIKVFPWQQIFFEENAASPYNYIFMFLTFSCK